MPEVCDSSWCAVRAANFGVRPGMCLPIGSVRLSLPCSASNTTAAAVNIFVVDPSLNSISGRIGSPVSTFATPKPRVYTTRSPDTTAMAAPGADVRVRSRRMATSTGAKFGEAWGCVSAARVDPTANTPAHRMTTAVRMVRAWRMRAILRCRCLWRGSGFSTMRVHEERQELLT